MYIIGRTVPAWGIDRLSRNTVPVFDHSASKGILLHVHSEPPLAPLCTIPMRLLPESQGGGISTFPSSGICRDQRGCAPASDSPN